MGLETPTAEVAVTAARAIAPELVAGVERTAVSIAENFSSGGLNLIDLSGGKLASAETGNGMHSATTFAELTGINFANRAPGIAIPLRDLPLNSLDRNSDLFQRMLSERLGLSYDKLNEGRIAILHPRFRFPEKQLLGKLSLHHDVSLWGNAKEGIGVVEYETFGSRKAYLSGANSIARIGVRTEETQSQNYARFVGSGVFVGEPEQGLLVTNQHVVADAKSIAVETTAGQKFAARLLDSNPEKDLAMIQVTDVPAGMRFPTARMGAPEDITEGAKVAAIGHHAALKGLIASPGTYKYFAPSVNLDVLSMDGGLPGMSGGGVFDRNGRLVGIAAKGLQTLIPEDRAFVGSVNLQDLQNFLSRVSPR